MKPKTIYCLHPGEVVSRTDGNIHYIGALELARLYGIYTGESVIWKPGLEPYKDEYVHLYPREDGNYELPKRGEAK